MHSQNEPLDMRLILKGMVKDRFLKIKQKLGLNNNTEVVRFLINNYYEEKIAEEAGS